MPVDPMVVMLLPAQVLVVVPIMVMHNGHIMLARSTFALMTRPLTLLLVALVRRVPVLMRLQVLIKHVGLRRGGTLLENPLLFSSLRLLCSWLLLGLLTLTILRFLIPWLFLLVHARGRSGSFGSSRWFLRASLPLGFSTVLEGFTLILLLGSRATWLPA